MKEMNPAFFKNFILIRRFQVSRRWPLYILNSIFLSTWIESSAYNNSISYNIHIYQMHYLRVLTILLSFLLRIYLAHSTQSQFIK